GRGTGRTGNRGGSGRRGRGTWWRRARDARRGSRLVLLLSRHLVEPRQELVAGHGADHPPFGDVPVGFPLHGLPFGGPEPPLVRIAVHAGTPSCAGSSPPPAQSPCRRSRPSALSARCRPHTGPAPWGGSMVRRERK